MLVVTRSEDQAVLLSGGIRVRILSIHGRKIRLGIEAPPGVTILREELAALAAAAGQNAAPLVSEVSTFDPSEAHP